MKKNLICLSFLIVVLFIARQGYSFTLVEAPSSSPLRSLDGVTGVCEKYAPGGSEADEFKYRCCRALDPDSDTSPEYLSCVNSIVRPISNPLRSLDGVTGSSVTIPVVGVAAPSPTAGGAPSTADPCERYKDSDPAKYQCCASRGILLEAEYDRCMNPGGDIPTPASNDCSAYTDAEEIRCCRDSLAAGKDPGDSCSTPPPPPPTPRPDTCPEVTCSVVPDPYNKCCRVDGGKLIFLPIEGCIGIDKIPPGDNPILCRDFFLASSGAEDAKINDCRNDCCDTCTAGGTICIQDCLKICIPTPTPPPPVTAAPGAAPEAAPGAGGTTTDGNSITTGQGGDAVTRNAVDGAGNAVDGAGNAAGGTGNAAGDTGKTTDKALSLMGGGGCSLLR